MNPALQTNTLVLFQAIRTNNVAGVRAALAKGVNFDQPVTARRAGFGDFPLHTAASTHANNMEEIITLMVDAGAPLMLAAETQQWDNFRTLLDNGANPYIRDATGHDPHDVDQHYFDPEAFFELKTRKAYGEYCEVLRETLCKTLNAETTTPQALRSMLLTEDGRATKKAKSIAYAHVMPEIFAPHRWSGNEAQAIELFEDVLAAMTPTLRTIMNHDVDMSTLRTTTLGSHEDTAVGRYTRRSAQGKEAQR